MLTVAGVLPTQVRKKRPLLLPASVFFHSRSDDSVAHASTGRGRINGPGACRGTPVKAKSTSGRRPDTISAIARPEPQPMVQPSVPWPVLRNRLLILVLPMYGTLD